jgi:hypothetical protein
VVAQRPQGRPVTTDADRRLLALVDDAALTRHVVELSSALAQQLQRQLEIVYVESAAALLAAALPVARVLAPGGREWQPFAPHDVERGYRAQEARLRALAERVTLRGSVHASLRVMRGALPQLAIELHAQSDLMLLGGAAVEATWPARRHRAVAVLTDASPAGEQARRVGEQVAQALGAALDVRSASADTVAQLARSSRGDLLVLPRTLVAPADLASLRQPVLLVG